MFFQKNPEIIEAVPFELGMEDGLYDMWLRYDIGNITKYGDSPYIVDKDLGLGRVVAHVPYINTANGGIAYVQTDSYIAKDYKGNKFLISEEELRINYSEVVNK